MIVLNAEQAAEAISSKFPKLILTTYYRGTTKDVGVMCKDCGYEWTTIYRNIARSGRCPVCDGGLELTQEMFDSKIKKIAPNLVPLEPYGGSVCKKMLFKCNECSHEWLDSPHVILRSHKGCPICTYRRCVPGANTISVTHPHIYRLMADKDLGNVITHKSQIKADFICDKCGVINSKYVFDVCKRGFTCKRCRDGISFPNKFVSSLLKQLKIEFAEEKKFEWSQRKIYDFYIPSLSTIIEVHGRQHYIETFKNFHDNARTLKEEQANDILKMNLAKSNGIKHYIVIDASKEPRIARLVEEILSSELSILFDTKVINFKLCEIEASSSVMIECCKMLEDGISKYEISDALNIAYQTVGRHIRRGISFGLCSNKYVKDKRRPAKGPKRPVICMEYQSTYSSAYVAGNSLHISYDNIRKCCNGLCDTAYRKATGEHLHWLYLKDYQEACKEENVS